MVRCISEMGGQKRHWLTQWCGDANMSKTLLQQLDFVEVDVQVDARIL